MNVLSLIVSLFALIGGLYGFYRVFIKPKMTKTKLTMFLKMIEEWFDELDCNLGKDLNISALNNKEKKIHEFVDNHLSHYQIKPKKKMIQKWNKKMGIKTELQDSSEIFQKFSRLPENGMFVDMFFTMLIANFYKFRSAYESGNKQECNFSNVEMPVKFLSFYVEHL